LEATLEGATIRLCGRLVVEMQGRRLEAALPSRQGRLVFVYLVLNRRRAVPRGELIDALWPESPPAAAQTLLTELLSRLRSALPPGTVQGRAQLSLALIDPWIDVEVAAGAVSRARDALAAGDAAAAITIAREGLELLAGPVVPEADRAWLDEVRRAVDELWTRLLELVARAGLLAGGDEAEPAARELIEREPFRESAHALLMEVHAARGDVAEALRVYENLRTLLRDELGTVPGPAVRALVDRLLAESDARTPPALPAPLRSTKVIVGRGAEVERVLDVWRADPEHGRLLLLTGEPGVGKTSLAAHAAARLEANGAMVLFGRSDPEPLVPYQPFAEALGELAETDRRGGDAQSARNQLFESVTRTIASASGGRRVVLVLDDAHWADRPTLLLLRHVLRHVPHGLTVLGTVRPFEERCGPLGELVVDLRREGRIERLRVEGLDPPAIGDLVMTRAGVAPHPEFVHWIHTRTGGNPFYAGEILRELNGVDVGSVPAVGVLDQIKAPEGVRDLVAQRLARLGPDTGHALRIAAALGPDVRLADVERVIGERAAAIAALDEAVAAGLLQEAGAAGRFAFAHALVREAIYDSLTATRRAALHLRIGESLEPDAAPAVLARHFHEARHLAGVDKAVAYHVAAAQASYRALAYEDEIDHYVAALHLLDEAGSADDALRCRILLEVGDREVSLGGDVRDRVVRAADLARRHGWADVLARAAVLHARIAEHGHVDRTSIRLLEDALAALGDEESPARARALSRLAEALYDEPGTREHRDALSRQALAMARRVGDDEVLMGVIHSRIRAISDPDSTDEQLALAAEGLELAPRIEDRAWAFGLYLIRSALFMQRGEPAAARAEFAALDALVSELRLRGTYNDAERAMLEATHRLISGDLDGAERLAHEAHDIFARLDDPDAEYVLTAQLLPIRLEQGRGDELGGAIARWAARSERSFPWKALLALLHLRGGRQAQARRELHALAADDFGGITFDEDWLGTLVVLAEVAAVVGEPAHAAALERRLEPYADRIALMIFSTLPLGPVTHALGRLARRLGRADEARARFEQARASALAIEAPLMVRSIEADLDG
jgi:DNA-binding SARP family transcriptional activator